MSNVVAVALTTIGASALLMSGLVAINAVAELRRLRARHTPRPWFLICRRVRGAILPPTCSPTIGAELDRRTGWLSWDLRWVNSGETLVRVSQAIPESMDLYLDLEDPIVLAATGDVPAVHLDRVRFVPRDPRKAAYNRSAVRGTLRPILAGGLMATAEIVVYPS